MKVLGFELTRHILVPKASTFLFFLLNSSVNNLKLACVSNREGAGANYDDSSGPEDVQELEGPLYRPLFM